MKGVLPPSGVPVPFPVATRDEAIASVLAALQGAQWSFWPLSEDLEARARAVIEAQFDQLFTHSEDTYAGNWLVTGPEVLITWRPQFDRRA